MPANDPGVRCMPMEVAQNLAMRVKRDHPDWFVEVWELPDEMAHLRVGAPLRRGFMQIMIRDYGEWREVMREMRAYERGDFDRDDGPEAPSEKGKN